MNWGAGGGLEFVDYEGNFPNLAVGVLVVINFYHSLITGTTLRSKVGSVALSWVRIRWPHWGRGILLSLIVLQYICYGLAWKQTLNLIACVRI